MSPSLPFCTEAWTGKLKDHFPTGRHCQLTPIQVATTCQRRITALALQRCKEGSFAKPESSQMTQRLFNLSLNSKNVKCVKWNRKGEDSGRRVGDQLANADWREALEVPKVPRCQICSFQAGTAQVPILPTGLGGLQKRLPSFTVQCTFLNLMCYEIIAR